MNFKSYGGRLVVFLVACSITLIAAGTASAISDDVAGTERGRVAAAAVQPDNDDNPHVASRTTSYTVESDDRPLTDRERVRITTAAAKAVGSGTVTDMEASDDLNTAYEAEVKDRAGTEWDVELDATFAVVSKSKDS